GDSLWVSCQRNTGLTPVHQDDAIHREKEVLLPAGWKPVFHHLARMSDFLTHPVFNTHHTETEMLRYIRRLEVKDLSLTTSMIPLGSCTMKLNATSEMMAVTWPEFGALHPFCPPEQAEGYRTLTAQLEGWL